MEELKEKSAIKLNPYYLVAIVLAIVIIAAVVLIIYCCTQRDEVVATVNGENIYQGEFYQAMLAAGGREALDQLIGKVLIVQEGRRQGITVSDKDLEDELNELSGELGDYFEQFLEQSGLTREQIKEEIRVNRYAKELAMKQIEISDEELQAHFEEHREDFDIPEQVKARHILVESREEAEKILSALKNGEDFAELVSEHSSDTATKDEGGNLGFFRRGVMDESFEEAAFSLPKGGISEPVETIHGFHVIEVLDRQPAREVTFEEVKEEVKEHTLDMLLPSKVQSILTSLWDEAEIDYRITGFM